LKDLVQKHFNATAEQFDNIYLGNKGLISRYLDKKLRWDMEKRFQRTIEECGNVEGKKIIDIGCGSGRFMEALHRKGPALILGVDFAPNMIEIAHNILHSQMPETPCKLVVGDFNRMEFEETFDIAIGIGLFDYIADPLTMLKKIRKVTSGRLIASFPLKGTFRAFIRKIRLSLYRCPVYFFSVDEVRNLLKNADFHQVKCETFGQLIFVAAE